MVFLIKKMKKEEVLCTYSFFVTSETKLLFCAVEVRSCNISFFCCWFRTIFSPLLVEIIKDLEKFPLDDIPLLCLFY